MRLLRATVAALLLVVASERACAAEEPGWIGAVTTDRFTDATWRMAVGRATGDRANRYELRVSCRREGSRRDLETDLAVFGADGQPLALEWSNDRVSGAMMRALRWRLDRQSASSVSAAGTETDNVARIRAWSWGDIEFGSRVEQRSRRVNAERQAFFAGLIRGRRLLIGDLVDGEVVEFPLPAGAAVTPCPLCEVLRDCLRGGSSPDLAGRS